MFKTWSIHCVHVYFTKIYWSHPQGTTHGLKPAGSPHFLLSWQQLLKLQPPWNVLWQSSSRQWVRKGGYKFIQTRSKHRSERKDTFLQGNFKAYVKRANRHICCHVWRYLKPSVLWKQKGVTVRNTFLESDALDTNNDLNRLWTSGMRKASQHFLQTELCTWFNQEAAALNGNRFYVAACIVLLLLCFDFLHLNCLWAAQSINVILKFPTAFAFLSHQGPCPPLEGSEEFHVTRWSLRYDVFTSNTVRTQ